MLAALGRKRDGVGRSRFSGPLFQKDLCARNHLCEQTRQRFIDRKMHLLVSQSQLASISGSQCRVTRESIGDAQKFPVCKNRENRICYSTFIHNRGRLLIRKTQNNTAQVHKILDLLLDTYEIYPRTNSAGNGRAHPHRQRNSFGPSPTCTGMAIVR